LDQSLKDFVAEAEDILDSLDEAISSLMDLRPDDHRKPDIINAIFRHAHSLKGLSGMFNLEDLSGVSHRLENILDGMRLGKVPVSTDVAELLGQGVQVLIRMVRAVGEGKGDTSVDYSGFIRDLDSLEKEDGRQKEGDLSSYIGVPEGMTEMLSEYEEHRFRDNIGKKVPFYRVTCSFSLETFDVELEKLGTSIREVGELLTTLPETGMGGESSIGFTLYFASREEEGAIREKTGDLEGLEAVPYLRDGALAEGGPEKVPVPTGGLEKDLLEDEIKGVSQTVRVDIEKLDYLMNLVGELIILKTGYVTLSNRLSERETVLEKRFFQDLEKNNSSLEKKLMDLRDAVMDIRMVPMGQLYSRLGRVSKKIARDLGKKVELEFSGHDTELDKMIMEEMIPPLLHIVRNSLDHGIEDTATRKSVGKNEIGKVRISAYQQGNHVLIEVTDDGQGIDLGKVKKHAIERGEIGENEALSEEEIVNLLFRPGFSTKEGVTELSGRGVGMDVVRRELENIGGAVQIYTVKGRGTRVILTLPITLAILQALLIRNGERVFAIPMGAIQETIELEPGQVKTMRGQEVINLRDQTMPLIRLERLFSLPEFDNQDGFFAVIISMGDRTMGLVASELLGKQDVVIKPLGEAFSGTVGLAGAAEMGDQSTILVLDVAGLLMEAVRMGAAARGS
jgi:two-component system chemotaxis sensor kinase CheA